MYRYKKVIMSNWIALNTPTQKELITEALEMTKLEKAAFRLKIKI